MNQEKIISQFVRGRDGNPRGIVVAKEINGIPSVGWSFVNLKAGDRFDKSMAYRIAIGRASRNTNAQIPHAVRKVMDTFIPRVQKVWKMN